MGVVLRSLGASTYSPFTSAGSGNDYVSRYLPYTDYLNTVGSAPPLTGAIGDTGSRPILFTYLQIYSSAGSAGTIDLQISPNADASGGTQLSGFPITTANNDWAITDSTNPLQYAAFARNSAASTLTYYYGFQKNDTNTYTFRRGVTPDSSYNPNGIYLNGTSVTTGTPAWSTTAMQARIRFATVSSAPTITATASGTNAIDLTWSPPSDDGATNNVIGASTVYPYHGIYGYRILTSTDNTNWSVYGSGTSGSPSGTHDLSFVPTGTPSPPTSETVSGLTPNTNYYFRVAALNIVTDRHGSVVVAPPASRAFANYTSTAAHTGTNSASSGAVRTLLAAPTASGTYTTTGNVNQAYSSTTIFSQATGGGASTNYALTYSVSSGSLPPGVTLNTSSGTISGTPTTPGTYTFRITAQNADLVSTQSATQTITVGTLAPKVYNGTSMTRSVIKVYNGSNWSSAVPVVKVWDGTSWKYLQ